MRASGRTRTRGGLFLLLGLLVLLPACGDEEASLAGSMQTYDSQGKLRRSAERPATLPNLIVLAVDSLRADALPSRDPPDGLPQEERMPFLASLARRGIRFDQAVASAPWTLPSMVSMLTGLQPSAHGQYQVHAGWHLPDAVTTYAEVLQAGYGYETAAYVVGRWFQRTSSNLLQGFSTHRAPFSLQDLETTVVRWDKNRDKEKPFFLLLHTFDAHDPYGEANHVWPPVVGDLPTPDPALLAPDADPAALTRAYYLDADLGMALSQALGPRFTDTLQRYKFRGFAEDPDLELAAELERAYWDGARWVDGLLRKTVQELEDRGLLENTLLVITSDHGEAFGEHGSLGHGLTLYDELLHIPLVMVGPPPFDGGRRIQGTVGLIDVLPTFLEWAGAQPLEGVHGRSAMGLIRGESWCRAVVSEERLTHANTADDVDAALLSVRTPEWKYIATFDLQKGTVHEEAYDLAVDPEEQFDLGEGSGRLPAGFAFGDCMCPAIETIRDRIWDDADAVVEEASAIPYGAAAPRARSPRPAPCPTPP